MSRIGRVVGMGLLTGLLFGAAMWYLNDDIWAGVIGGVAYGGVMAALMRNLWGSRAFKGLDRAQRKRVLRTMRRGEPMDDPELARPLVEQASAILAVPFSHMWLRIVFGLMFALGATGGILALVDGRTPGWSSVFLVLFALVMIFVVVPANGRQRARIAQSKQATESRWGGHPTGSHQSGIG